MTTYKVKIVSQEHNINKMVDCDDDQYILEATEDAGLDLPYSCRAGACSSCAGKLLKGSVDQSEQGFLESDKLDEGYILTCVAYPTADCEIESHAEEDLF